MRRAYFVPPPPPSLVPPVHDPRPSEGGEQAETRPKTPSIYLLHTHSEEICTLVFFLKEINHEKSKMGPPHNTYRDAGLSVFFRFTSSHWYCILPHSTNLTVVFVHVVSACLSFSVVLPLPSIESESSLPEFFLFCK